MTLQDWQTLPKTRGKKHTFLRKQNRPCTQAVVWPALYACNILYDAVSCSPHPSAGCLSWGYLLKAGQLEYDCRYSKMHGMRITDGRGFRSLKPLLKVDKIHQEIYSDNTAL